MAAAQARISPGHSSPALAPPHQVRFGAEAVFNASSSDPTEADIDALLARGEERTRADNEKLQKQTNSLANFSLGGEEKSLYEFEGRDMSDKGRCTCTWLRTCLLSLLLRGQLSGLRPTRTPLLHLTRTPPLW